MSTPTAAYGVMIASLVASVLPVSQAIPAVHQHLAATIKGKLEHRIPRAHLLPQDHVTGFIALGGSVARAREAARLAAHHPGSVVVITGASAREYDVARRIAPYDALRIEPNAKTTYQNALFTKRLVAPRRGERWVLVTSAVHMPRAIGAFSAIGFGVEPWPVYDLNQPGIDFYGAVRHEVLGLLGYYMLGRSNALFPGPGTGGAVRKEGSG